MSTRACYRFISPEGPDSWAGVVTVYKHSDGYPEGAAQWIEAAQEYAWPLPRFENDDFAAAFVAANKSQVTYYERLARQCRAEAADGKPRTVDQQRELLQHATRHEERAAEYRTGRMKDFVGGGVRLVPYEGMNAHARFASDTEYLYDISVKPVKAGALIRNGNYGGEKVKLVVTAYATIERDGKWWVKKFFEGSTKQLAKAKTPEYDDRKLGEPDFEIKNGHIEVEEVKNHRVKISYSNPDDGVWYGPLESLSDAKKRFEAEQGEPGLVSIQTVT